MYRHSLCPFHCWSCQAFWCVYDLALHVPVCSISLTFKWCRVAWWQSSPAVRGGISSRGLGQRVLRTWAPATVPCPPISDWAWDGYYIFYVRLLVSWALSYSIEIAALATRSLNTMTAVCVGPPPEPYLRRRRVTTTPYPLVGSSLHKLQHER